MKQRYSPATCHAKAAIYGNRRFTNAKRKKFDDDRQAVCDYLKGLLGKDWASASVPLDVSRRKLNPRLHTTPSQ